MTKQELQEILKLHQKWLDGEEGGQRANLREADLQEANLQEADLQEANLQEANLWGANLRGANLQGANLREADLWGANLQGANLRRADLWGANLDYSVWPLWCGGLHVKTDKRIMAQLAYHFCAQDCDDTEYIKARNAILWFANQFHRANECGELERKEEKAIEEQR